MAIDAAIERYSATHLLLPFRGGCIPGTSGVVAAERRAVTWAYSSISGVGGFVSTAYTPAQPGQTFKAAQPGKAYSSGQPKVTFS